jgi:error-prone DNA polymerase
VAKARRAGNGAPFGSVEEVARRRGVGRRALEALAAADAFGTVGPAAGGAVGGGRLERTDDQPLFHAATSAASRGDDGPLREPAPRPAGRSAGRGGGGDYAATG